jgi:chromosome segregation ATPase
VLDGQAGQDAPRQIDAATTAIQQAHTCADSAMKTSAAMTLRPSTLNNLSTLIHDIAEWDAQLQAALASIEQLTNTLADVSETEPTIQQVLGRANHAHAALKQAQAAVRSASDQAKRLEVARPETLDAREWIRAELGRLSDLISSRADQHTKLADAAHAIAQTEEQRYEVDAALAVARSAISDLDDSAKQASAAVGTLFDEAKLPTTLLGAQKAIEQLRQTNKRAQEATQAAIFAVRASALPRQLTAPILEQICLAMWPDPNVRYVLNFYQHYGKPDNGAPQPTT